MKRQHRPQTLLLCGAFLMGLLSLTVTPWVSAEPLVIAASPSLATPLEALARAYEVAHPDVQVKLYFDSGLDLRRMIAGMENSPTGQYFIGTGPIHLIAPGGDELITRLQQKYYVLPGSKRPYATVSLMMIVPESLVEAPVSFVAMARDTRMRVAVADPDMTLLGQKTRDLFKALGIADVLNDRMDVATDARGVVDHVLNGQADVGIIFGPDAVEKADRVRVVAVASEKEGRPILHSMAMERYCPNRTLCDDFLAYVQSAEAGTILTRLGYGVPTKP